MKRANMIFTGGIVVLMAILILQWPNLAKAQEITVMTRNLYIGAEIQSLAASETEDEFIAGVQAALEQIAANNFPERAAALSVEIVEKDPHLVGLQEVYNFTLNGLNSLPPFRNYLNDLLNALEDQGASYYVAATVKNLDINLPFAGMELSITDRDVILAREDIETEVVDLTMFCPEKQSLDGCNYSFVASATTPIGLIPFQRGYLAVDASIGSFPMRFFNTHLEVRNPDPLNPLSLFVQRAQASELTFVLDALSSVDPVSGPTLVVGDINSSPEDVGSIAGLYSPYMQFRLAEFADTWKLRPGKTKGLTCCYDEDLTNPANLYERIDMILTNVEPIRVKANGVGNEEADQTPSGLWPSDHAGVVARIEF